ncbi:MAG TPA: hypothetical protein VK281_00515 [Xanthobacteraceae bacterium]|nr:hypothetical protein [Xanthobacteraceae bacterium]
MTGIAEPSRKPNVTIFADASHDGTARVAGWGAWIKDDGWPSGAQPTDARP